MGCGRISAVAVESGDHWRRSVDFEAVADFVAGERVSGCVRGRVGSDHFDLVAAVGDLRRVKAEGLVGDLILEQSPDGLVVAAKVERVGQVVAVIVVGGPAGGDGGAVLDGAASGWDGELPSKVVPFWFDDGKVMLTF